uniref:Uncharacterized protein n=1 Tax=Pyxicephalus adspersus TaxID=30357 RepID=A0AAV3B580_PYXAD|nr:TPA: hypothetical protein GDO54_000728 [Pyxicephalus adspersus]
MHVKCNVFTTRGNKFYAVMRVHILIYNFLLVTLTKVCLAPLMWPHFLHFKPQTSLPCTRIGRRIQIYVFKYICNVLNVINCI